MSVRQSMVCRGLKIGLTRQGRREVGRSKVLRVDVVLRKVTVSEYMFLLATSMPLSPSVWIEVDSGLSKMLA